MTAIANRKYLSRSTFITSQVARVPSAPLGRRPAGPLDTFEPARPTPVVLAPGLPTSPNDARVKQALTALGQLVISSNGAITKRMIDSLVRGIAQPRGTDSAGSEGVLTVSSAVNAAKTVAALSPQSRKALTQLTAKVGRADPLMERALIYKAVSARTAQLGSSDPAVVNAALAEVSTFAANIRGKGTVELIHRTSVIDLNIDDVPEGLQQRFWMSCVTTAFQIVKAEADPIYAWKLNGEQLAALDAPNGPIGVEQKRWLEAGGGVAVARNTLEGGQGMWPERTIDEVLSQTTGLHYTRHDMNSPETRAAAFDHIAGLLEQGLDVPMVAGPSTNHCMVFTDVREDVTGRRFLLQDPWTGQSRWMSEATMVAGNTRFGVMDGANCWITYDPSPL